MRISRYYIGSFLALALMASCNNSDSGKSGETSSSLFEGKDEKKEANELITFNNTIVKLDNTHSSSLKTFTSNFDRFDEFVKQKVQDPNGFNSIAPIMIMPPIINSSSEIVYPDGMSKEFKPLLDQMTESFKAVQAINKEIEVYKSAEDWKEDQGKKLVELREKATTEIKKNRDASNQIFEKLQPIVSKAEEITLEGNPLKDQYVRSKKLLDKVQQTTNMTFESTDLAKLTEDFKKNYQEIEKVYNENKNDELPKEYKSKERSFVSFNDSVNDFLGKMRIIQRELDAGTPITDNALTGIDNGSQNVLRSYNSFVD